MTSNHADATPLAVRVGPLDHALGLEDARATLVLYGDYECPYTARALPVVGELVQRFGDDLRFVFRNFPLREIHPHAQRAAEAAEAADAQGKFWEMHETLFARQRSLEAVSLDAYAAELDLGPARCGHELAAHSHAPRIQADLEGGIASGVKGTPTFFVNGRRHDASYDRETMVRAIESAGSAVSD
ncbi:MAG: DsbA family protein [Chloroflexota bacterium]|nr:DsbA family protein [Chloroflexota bacterium]